MEGKNLFESLMVFGTIFSRSYEVAELRVKKLYFDLSDVIHANEHAIYANCGLHVGLWNFSLMLFCFMMQMDHVKQKLLLWPQIPFKLNFCFMTQIRGNLTLIYRVDPSWKYIQQKWQLQAFFISKGFFNHDYHGVQVLDFRTFVNFLWCNTRLTFSCCLVFPFSSRIMACATISNGT